MKSYTNLNQSKKLVEFLPIESADMWYQHIGYSITDGKEKPTYFPMVIRDNISDDDIPAWSLAALLEQLDDSITNDDGNDLLLEIHKEDAQYYINYHDRWGNNNDIETDYYDDLVDACVAMIEKLHEQKLL